jgi:MFS family permease
MAVLSETTPEFTDDRLAARNALVLAVAQALSGANATVIVATGGIAGSVLAPNPALATLPISIMVVGMWAATLPVGALAKAFGRRFALLVGSGFGVAAGAISSAAMLTGSFALLLLGTACGGCYAAAQQSYRFAAADTASVSFRAKAVAWVLAGGICSAILGPQLIVLTREVWPSYLFAGTYLAQAACALAAAAVLGFLRIPRPPSVARFFADGRPLAEIIRAPRFLVAASCGVASYLMMNLMMTAAPLAIVMCHHAVSDAALGIQWHVIGMYAPSFFAGALIARFGQPVIIGCGLFMIAAAAAIGLLGVALWNFWIALALLGVGWNFAFIGATALVTECHGPRERNKVQAFNDFVVFGATAIGSFVSGALLARYGWAAVNAIVFPIVLGAGALLMWNALTDRPQPA